MISEAQIADAVAKNKIIIGIKEVIVLSNQKKLKSIVTANNIPKNLDAKISSLNTEIHKFSGDSISLGRICKRAHNVLVAGITE